MNLLVQKYFSFLLSIYTIVYECFSCYWNNFQIWKKCYISRGMGERGWGWGYKKNLSWREGRLILFQKLFLKEEWPQKEYKVKRINWVFCQNTLNCSKCTRETGTKKRLNFFREITLPSFLLTWPSCIKIGSMRHKNYSNGLTFFTKDFLTF